MFTERGCDASAEAGIHFPPELYGRDDAGEIMGVTSVVSHQIN